MSRLEILRPSDLVAAQRELYDRIRAARAASTLTDADGGLRGPFNAMLYAPSVGDALQQLGAAVRFGTSLSDRAREIAILAVATHWDSAFERQAHEAIGRSVGLTEDEILALRSTVEPALDDPIELATLRVVRSLLNPADLSDVEYDEAMSTLGASTLFELSTLVGYYSMLALQMRIFRVVP